MTRLNGMRMPDRVLTLSTTLACVAPLLAACSTGGPATVEGLRPIVGTRLIGALGRTAADQDKIDSTVARLCGGQVYTRDECERHGEAVNGDRP